MARPCISNDLERMESLAKNIYDSINENMSLDEAKEKITEILGTKVATQPTELEIKKWVVIGRIPTTCDSDFYFFVNVTAFQKGKVLRLGIWSESAPKGYQSGHMTNFSTDFVKLRRDKAEARLMEKQRAAEAERRHAEELERKRHAEELERKRHAAEAEKERRAAEVERKRLAAEAEKERRAAEVERNRRAAEVERERIRNLPDPCAPGLSAYERLARLRLSGKVRQISDREFETEHHRIVFYMGWHLGATDRLLSCR